MFNVFAQEEIAIIRTTILFFAKIRLKKLCLSQLFRCVKLLFSPIHWRFELPGFYRSKGYGCYTV